MLHALRGLLRKRLLATLVSASVLIISPFALAAIISGNSTSGISAHVTYTQLTLNTPSVAQGDLMLASIAVIDGSSDNVTPPSGWTQVARTDNDVNVTLISYSKVASAQEPGSYTWTIDKQTRAVGGITPYTGVDPNNPIDAVAGNTGFSPTATTTAITTSAANEEVVSLFATNVGKSFSTPAGMTAKYNQQFNNVAPSTAAFDTLQVSAGSTGSVSSAIDAHQSRYWATQQIALRRFVPAIALDTHTGADWWDSSGPFTLPMTISGSNRLLLVNVTIEDPTNPDQVTDVTFGGSNLTLLKKVAANQNGNDETYLYAMVAPPLGTNNISVTPAGSLSHVIVEAADYTGVSQTIPSNIAFNTATNQTSFSVGPLTTNSNSWVVGALANNASSVSVDAPNVVRDASDGYGARVLVDSNGPTGGSDTINASVAWANSAWLGIFAELAPAQ